MHRSCTHKLALVAVAAAALSPAPVHADAIDGEWCLAGSHFKIEGLTIFTPGGNRVQGNYTRHSFSYTVPGGEAGAGTNVAMLLLDEENVELRAGTSAPIVWRRCKVTS